MFQYDSAVILCWGSTCTGLPLFGCLSDMIALFIQVILLYFPFLLVERRRSPTKPRVASGIGRKNARERERGESLENCGSVYLFVVSVVSVIAFIELLDLSICLLHSSLLSVNSNAPSPYAAATMTIVVVVVVAVVVIVTSYPVPSIHISIQFPSPLIYLLVSCHQSTFFHDVPSICWPCRMPNSIMHASTTILFTTSYSSATTTSISSGPKCMRKATGEL